METKQQTLDEYQEALTPLIVANEEGKDVEGDLNTLIDHHLEANKDDLTVTEFLRGEKAFFSGQYKLALMHYLAAKDIPNYQFYCYRTSAYLSYQLEQNDKAVQFAEKALGVNPDDHLAQQVLLQAQSKVGDSTDEVEPIALEEEEIDQLSAIFEETPAEETTTTSPVKNLDEVEESLNELNQNQKTSTFTEPTMDTERETTSNESVDTTATNTVAENTTTTETTAETTTATTETTSSYLPLEELDKLANSTSYAVEEDSTSSYISEKLGVNVDTTETLDTRIHAHQNKQAECITRYLEEAQKQTARDDSTLLLLQGWEETATATTNDPASVITDAATTTCGGFFLRWNGKGVAVNPGRNFLKNLHKNGLHVTDIDFVVVTRPDAQSSCDVKAIYDLNYKLNCHATDLHVINYYLNPKTHQEIAATLKPNFKQERKTVHCLELYIDSPDVEKIDLSSEITLRYFPTTNTSDTTAYEATRATSKACIGACFDLKNPSDFSTLTQVGYVSGTAWSPVLAQHLGQCDVLITGFENTNPDDYNKLKYNDENLGYFGTCSLMEEIAPQVLICTEFDGREGDIRLEVARKMRQEYSYGKTNATTVVPGDVGMQLNLKTLQFRCSITGKAVDPQHVTLIKMNEAFGKLLCISPNSCL